ncbi:OLC1v1029386C1 [Oldenlandia corymbosa var. corymbosa]|uniref:OLC1v1029386C1 n=1 Tax=Oldenlandia corymbosa var. corymbosa TaxID=529605 RepID=A0AAV1CDS8_OLDCO|nr:OLC1v1029386C1 [Oldenlandia corymbosa var. corymbosa]
MNPIPLFQKLNQFFSNIISSLQFKSIDSDYHDHYLVISTIVFVLVSTWVIPKLIKLARGEKPLPPGPPGLPLVGSLPFIDPELHSYFANLARKYGPIFSLRLGGKVAVVISSPAIAREVLKDQDTIFANRDPPVVITAMDYGGHDIVFTPYGPEWRMLRKVCVRDMLGHANLDAVYSYRRQEIRNTVKYFYDRRGSPVDVGEQMFLTVLNVITSMLWGGTIQGKERAAIGAEFKQVVGEVTKLLGMPNVSDFFPWLAFLDLQGAKKEMKIVISRLEEIFQRIIDQRTRMDGQKHTQKGGDGNNQSKDFLQVLLQLKAQADAKTPLTMDHVKSMLVDMVVGGTETTSNTVEFTMAEMMNKPEIMKKAQQELDSVVGEGNVVEESHIQKLPYLHAVMKEALRLHPALPLMVNHCPSQTTTVSNYRVPKGAQVFVNVWAIHRDPSIWEDPSEFRPERFLNGKGDYSGNDYNYIPFGSGRRMCAGMAMGERMVLFSLASLLHSFNWELPVGAKLEVAEKFGIVLKKKSPLIAIPTPRLNGSAFYEFES